MDLQVAAGANIRVRGLTIDGKSQDLEFGRLLMEDLAALQARVPGDNRFITIFELARYAETHAGSEEVLLMARKKIDPEATAASVRKMGSILDRVKVSRVIMAATLTTGEDEALPDDGKKKGREIGHASGS